MEIAIPKAPPSARLTAVDDASITLFLIGMRLNSLHRVDRWGPVLIAFPRMLRHLSDDPTSGLLHSELWAGRTTISVQYWTSPEALRRFASDTDAPHLEAWRRFRRLGADGHVGIWHETYETRPDAREAIYAAMPSFGLGAAVGTTPVVDGLRTARQRMAYTHTETEGQRRVPRDAAMAVHGSSPSAARATMEP